MRRVSLRIDLRPAAFVSKLTPTGPASGSPEGDLDLGDLRLDEFEDSDKLDIGSSTLG